MKKQGNILNIYPQYFLNAVTLYNKFNQNINNNNLEAM